ncbi:MULTISPECIES: YkvA family protein [unclassified Anabaena]|uniref:YkvA family protein n=1 Tax=unclassified Anabaena TaxID=2619674 RepID=UPI0008346693|nr:MULTISPECIES: YkvA family protein [unclassified Anabaena]
MNFSVQALYNWYRNVLRNPKYRWWVILGSILYMLSPIDIAPDFIPIVGQLDDVLLLSILVTEVSGLVMEGWKARKGETNTSTDSTSTDDTIDVDAVSVK